MAMNRADYPPDWESLRAQILARAGNRCEECGAENGQPHPVTGSKVVLTTAHLDGYEKSNGDVAGLRAWCQRCHLNYDRPHHLAEARKTRAAKIAVGQRDLFSSPDSIEEPCE